MRYIAILLVLPIAAFAANIFVWNYQATDTIYDSEAGMTVDHTYWVQQILTGLGHTLTVDTLLPSSLSGYQAAFIMCGWYNC
jgi:hypothetical protein